MDLSSLILGLCFGVFGLLWYHESKVKEQKQRERWLYSSRTMLLHLSDRFEHTCASVTEDAFEKYVWNVRFNKFYCTLERHNAFLLSNHKLTIENLKEYYTNTEKLAEMYSCGYVTRRREFEELPDYLIEEYHQRINDIASKYRDINFAMMMRIRTIDPEYIKNSEPPIEQEEKNNDR